MKRPIFAVVGLATIVASLMAVAAVQATMSGDIITELVDIRPGPSPNDINLKSKGVIPVAILSSESFDATDVDVSSVMFALGATPVHGGHFEDVDVGDGLTDLLLHFKTQDTGLTAFSTLACLTGSLNDGTPILGCDSVNIVGPSP